jgi:starch synthase
MKAIHVLRKWDRSEWGGTETAMERMFHGLQGQGVDSVLYCPRLERPSETPDAPQVKRFKAFVPVMGITEERRRQMVAVGGNLMSFELASALWREREASLIHTHTLGRIGSIARVIAQKRRLPFVVSIHGGVFDLPERVRKAFHASVGKGLEWGRVFGLVFGSRNLFRDADCIVTCNEKEAALLRKKGARVFVQPHGVPVEVYREDHRAAAGSAFPKIAGRQLLLCVGRVDPIKNQAWLLDRAPDIFKKHPEAMLVLAGPCTDEPYGKLVEGRIKELGIGDRVLLTGGFPPNAPALIGLMQEAAVVLLPSQSETFGLVTLEAWAAGAVVVSSRTSGPSALIQHAENGWLFDLENPASFHEAVDQALADQPRARQMARTGAAISEKHSLAAVAARLKGLYEQLVEQKRCAT